MEFEKENMKRIGLFVTEKKSKKFDCQEFNEECRRLNMEVVKLDLQQPLHQQGPFDIILHKITAVYAQALDGNVEARTQAEQFERYLLNNPRIPVVDPVPGVHTLLHRPATYALLQSLTAHDDQVMTPTYVELADTDVETKNEKLAKAGVTFPIVCKPVFGCGMTAAHELALVLTGRRLAEWCGPCVAQSFVQHGAVLYKLYVLGQHWHLVVRPSLKNFRAADAPTVHFNSSKVSKAGSCSPLTQLDQSDRDGPLPQPDHSVFDRIVRLVRNCLNMDLLGIDVVIDSCTGQYAIIDVNPFPSYDSVTNLMPCLAKLLHDKIASNEQDGESVSVDAKQTSSITHLLPPLETGFDGLTISRRTVDSAGINIDELLRVRGHLHCVSDVQSTNTSQTITNSKQNSKQPRSNNSSEICIPCDCVVHRNEIATAVKYCAKAEKNTCVRDYNEVNGLTNGQAERHACSQSSDINLYGLPSKESSHFVNGASVVGCTKCLGKAAAAATCSACAQSCAEPSVPGTLNGLQACPNDLAPDRRAFTNGTKECVPLLLQHDAYSRSSAAIHTESTLQKR